MRIDCVVHLQSAVLRVCLRGAESRGAIIQAHTIHLSCRVQRSSLRKANEKKKRGERKIPK